MTELTETKQAPETIEEIALSIVVRGLPFSAFRNEAERQNVKAWLQAAIVSALRNERERCAKVTEEQSKRLKQIREQHQQRIEQNRDDTDSHFDIDFLLSLFDSDSQAVEVDRLRRGLESIRDCTPDIWACSMAEQTLNGSPFEDALAASKQYDTDEGFDAATAMRDKCREVVLDYFTLTAPQMIAKYGTHIPQDAVASLTLDELEPEK